MIVWAVFLKDFTSNPKSNIAHYNNPYIMICETVGLAMQQVRTHGGYAVATDTQIPFLKPSYTPKPPVALIHTIKTKETEASIKARETDPTYFGKEMVEDYSWNEEVLRWLNA